MGFISLRFWMQRVDNQQHKQGRDSTNDENKHVCKVFWKILIQVYFKSAILFMSFYKQTRNFCNFW